MARKWDVGAHGARRAHRSTEMSQRKPDSVRRFRGEKLPWPDTRPVTVPYLSPVARPGEKGAVFERAAAWSRD